MNNPFENIEQRLTEIEGLIISLKEENPTPKSTSYLTRQEAAAFLHITLPTLHTYTRLGLISAKRIGTRVLYSETDLQNSLQNIPKRLDRR